MTGRRTRAGWSTRAGLPQFRRRAGAGVFALLADAAGVPRLLDALGRAAERRPSATPWRAGRARLVAAESWRSAHTHRHARCTGACHASTVIPLHVFADEPDAAPVFPHAGVVALLLACGADVRVLQRGALHAAARATPSLNFKHGAGALCCWRAAGGAPGPANRFGGLARRVGASTAGSRV
uniref:Uncharacterized protein n=1 Tax=Heliothis virescens TaxID=7102 RepID=A0A2A4JGB9_HELVI